MPPPAGSSPRAPSRTPGSPSPPTSASPGTTSRRAQTIATSSAGRGPPSSSTASTSCATPAGPTCRAAPTPTTSAAWCSHRPRRITRDAHGAPAGAAATIRPTWDTLGLRATASHHVDLGDRVEIPAWRTFTMARPHRHPTGRPRQRHHDRRDDLALGRGGAARRRPAGDRGRRRIGRAQAAPAREDPSDRAGAVHPRVRRHARPGRAGHRRAARTSSTSCGAAPATGRPPTRRTGPPPAGRRRSGRHRRRRRADGRAARRGRRRPTGPTRWSA